MYYTLEVWESKCRRIQMFLLVFLIYSFILNFICISYRFKLSMCTLTQDTHTHTHTHTSMDTKHAHARTAMETQTHKHTHKHTHTHTHSLTSGGPSERGRVGQEARALPGTPWSSKQPDWVHPLLHSISRPDVVLIGPLLMWDRNHWTLQSQLGSRHKQSKIRRNLHYLLVNSSSSMKTLLF